MLVLGIETATLVAGVALVNRDRVISEHFINNRKTHSQNLMPMIKVVLEEGGISPKELQAIAISKGPGSFTGLRIGMATAKTLAQALEIPIIGVPTLDGLANNLSGVSGIICPILDAKKNQVYTALYQSNHGNLELLSDYLAISIEELVLKVKETNLQVTFLGDGVPVFSDEIKSRLGEQAKFAKVINSLPRGASIASLGLDLLEKGYKEDVLRLQPFYVRQSEAEINWEKKRSNGY